MGFLRGTDALRVAVDERLVALQRHQIGGGGEPTSTTLPASSSLPDHLWCGSRVPFRWLTPNLDEGAGLCCEVLNLAAGGEVRNDPRLHAPRHVETFTVEPVETTSRGPDVDPAQVFAELQFHIFAHTRESGFYSRSPVIGP